MPRLRIDQPVSRSAGSTCSTIDRDGRRGNPIERRLRTAAHGERTVGLFVASYALVWLAAAAASSVALVAVRSAFLMIDLAAWTGLICCVLAAGWQLSAAKVRAVNRCHGTVPLRPWAPDADRDAIGFGLLHGTRCVRACLPVMVLPLAGGHGPGAMAAVFAILLAERAGPKPQYRLSAVVLVLLGVMTMAVGAARTCRPPKKRR